MLATVHPNLAKLDGPSTRITNYTYDINLNPLSPQLLHNARLRNIQTSTGDFFVSISWLYVQLPWSGLSYGISATHAHIFTAALRLEVFDSELKCE